MAHEGVISLCVASVVDDVLEQHGIRSREIDLESRRAEESASRRYEAASWLRKTVGMISVNDLPLEPSEEELRISLRSGLILCNALNRVHRGSVPKVVESSFDSDVMTDGAALSAYQYFENVRNFLVASQELGIPTFEASDLEHGGTSARVVNCILALKSYGEWKLMGEKGCWKFGGNVKSTTLGKNFTRKDSFTGSPSRTLSFNRSYAPSNPEHNKMSGPPSLKTLVKAILAGKRTDEVADLVESVLTKVVEKFEERIANEDEKKTPKEDASSGITSFLKYTSPSKQIDEKGISKIDKKEFPNNIISNLDSIHQKEILDCQQRHIEDLKKSVHTTKAGMEFIQKKFNEDFYNLTFHVRGLSHIASSYHKVFEENRKLYNQVQDLKGSIRVYCRVRPHLDGKSNYLSTVSHIEEGNITLNITSNKGNGSKCFSFNKVFGPTATQDDVFSDTQPLIRSVLDGYNVCIFAYGQTGSGKTYTMTGPKEITEESQGVNYRALRDLFILSQERKNTFRYDVSVQMIEIYNEQVRDLLVSDGANRRLDIMSSSQTGISVPDANIIPVASTSDVINLMNLGQRNRVVGATALNERSSRSHSCLTIHVKGRDISSGNILHGCMHLVDLAGSERVDKSEVTGDRLKEAQHINKSLSALGDVIYSLAQKNPHVPYRNSKLTQLLQYSLGGQAKTLMFVHISPETYAIAETMSTLKFAERVSTVELGAARVHKEGAGVKELKEQIVRLKAALTKKEADTMVGRIKPFRDSSNIELEKKRYIPRVRSFDPEDFLNNCSPTWSSPISFEEERDYWVDKAVNPPIPTHGFDPSNSDDLDSTSDSLETDLGWAANSLLCRVTPPVSSRKPISKSVETSKSKIPTPFKKGSYGRGERQPVSAEGRRKQGVRR